MCIGFAWQGFGGGGYQGGFGEKQWEASLIELMPAGSKMDLLLGKAESPVMVVVPLC